MHAQPLVPRIGGKRRLLKHILPLFPPHVCYCEVFAGAAAVFFAKTAVEVEVINDVDGEIMNLYRVVKNHLDEFARQFRFALVSRQMWDWLQATPPEILTDIQRAARYYYMQKTCFGGKVSGRTFGTSPLQPSGLNLLRMEEDLSAAHLRLARACIESLPWRECVEKYDREGTLSALLGHGGLRRRFPAF